MGVGGTGSCFKLPQPEPTQIKESDECVSQGPVRRLSTPIILTDRI